jgi:hypothetical protein
MHGFFRTLAASLFLVMPGNANELLSTLPVESLDGKQELLSSVLPTHSVLLITGFTRSSRSQTRAWSQRFGKDYAGRDDISALSIAVIEDVPHLLRGMVKRGIRKGVPEELHRQFFLVTQNSADWKHLTSYTDGDYAYLVLLDCNRQVAWQGSGDLDPSSYAALAEAIDDTTAVACSGVPD